MSITAIKRMSLLLPSGPVSYVSFPDTTVIQVTATDADDATYGNSARVVYSIVQGQPYFSVEPHTGQCLSPPAPLYPPHPLPSYQQRDVPEAIQPSPV